MKRVLLFLIVPALVAAFTLTGDTAYSKGPPAKAQPEYLALGASYAFGFGASDPATKGYVPLFRDFLESKDGLNKKGTDLLLNNLSFPGRTSSQINDEQLPVALLELQDRNTDKNKKNDVVVVTASSGGGGNDLLQFFFASPEGEPCRLGDLIPCFEAVADVLDTFEDNFEVTLESLREAAGPDTTIITQTFPNSFRRTGCAPPELVALFDGVLEGIPGTPIEDGLNDITRSVAAAHDVKVAEIFFSPFLGNEDALILFPDCVHPNDDGYALIAELFIDAFND